MHTVSFFFFLRDSHRDAETLRSPPSAESYRGRAEVVSDIKSNQLAHQQTVGAIQSTIRLFQNSQAPPLLFVNRSSIIPESEI